MSKKVYAVILILFGCSDSKQILLENHAKENKVEVMISPKIVEIKQAEIIEEDTECEGLIGNPEIFGKQQSLNGKWAVGETLTSGKFVPMLYFRSKEDAEKCADGELIIMKFQAGDWVE